MNQVKCSDCQHFTRDTVGNGTGIGQCSGIARAKRFLADKVVNGEMRIKEAANKLAEIEKECDAETKPLYPDVLRLCTRFKGK